MRWVVGLFVILFCLHKDSCFRTVSPVRAKRISSAGFEWAIDWPLQSYLGKGMHRTAVCLLYQWKAFPFPLPKMPKLQPTSPEQPGEIKHPSSTSRPSLVGQSLSNDACLTAFQNQYCALAMLPGLWLKHLKKNKKNSPRIQNSTWIHVWCLLKLMV